ncbi:hypothetical protein RhiirB3_386378 [Rhizophagus irregularis]|nr:hypothetical protein RhiirB3_386378 [Rhizophagus irregularis]
MFFKRKFLKYSGSGNKGGAVDEGPDSYKILKTIQNRKPKKENPKELSKFKMQKNKRKKTVQCQQLPCHYNCRLTFRMAMSYIFDVTDYMELEKKMPAPTPALSSSNKTGSKEKIDEFTKLNEDFSKRLPLQPLLSTISKKDKLSLDDLDEELDNNKKK